MAGRAEVPATRAGEMTLADGLEVLRADHRRLRQLMAEVGRDSGSSSANVYGRRRAADALVAELRTHLAAEDRCLRPILDELPQRGRTIAEGEIPEAEHAAECMRILLEADPMDNTFAPAAAHLLGHLERHIARQEQEWFPLLLEAAGPERLALLGDQLRRAKAESARI